MRMRCISASKLLVTAILAMMTARPAAADFRLQYPDAETGETAFEPIGDYGHDPRGGRSGEKSFVEEFERGVNSFWRTELELAQERPAGAGQIDFSAVVWENIFVFGERGEYPIDSGFFFEFGKTTLPNTPNEATFGPIFRKEVFGTINTVNLFMQKDIGRFASGRPAFLYAWETRIALGTPIEPGFQAYGQPSSFEGFNSGWPTDNRIGPQLFGIVSNIGPGTLRWNAGILFGIGSGAPRETIRWQAEYEIHF